MDPFTNSLNSQLQMLDINENQTIINNNTIITQLPPPSTNDDLPNDLNLLKDILLMRVKYTRPKQGGYWEFNNVPNDINYLKDCIKYIDNNCTRIEENEISIGYKEFLEPLEMTSEELDYEFNIKFYEYLPFESIRDEIIKLIENSKYDYLTNLIKFDRKINENVKNSWIIFQGNNYLNIKDYTLFYDRMDQNLKEWILDYCDINDEIYYKCQSNELTTFKTFEIIINLQNKSNMIKLLIDKIIEIKGSEEFIDLKKGFLTYLTYIEHLQISVEKCLPKCKNPYRTTFLLILLFKGLNKFTLLSEKFQSKLENFLNLYPDFTLGELSTFLERNNFPQLNSNNKNEMLMIMN